MQYSDRIDGLRNLVKPGNHNSPAAQHLPELTSHNHSAWINMGFSARYSESSRTHPNGTKLHREKERVQRFCSHRAQHEDASSQNSGLLRDLCRRNCHLHMMQLSHIFCLFSCCLKWNMLLLTFPHICNLLTIY